jgi:hypothetical protein
MKSYTVAYIHGISRVNAFPKYQDPEYSIQDISYRDGWFGPKRVVKSVCQWGDCMPVEKWSSNKHYIEDDTVYMKPHAYIHYANDSRRTEFFETPEELKEFMDHLQTLAPHIIL